MLEPKRYRKTAEVDAVHWDGTAEGATPIIDWILATGTQSARYHDANSSIGPANIAIDTLEGTLFASPGDWILRGVRGEFWACKPDIFDETYEEVST